MVYFLCVRKVKAVGECKNMEPKFIYYYTVSRQKVKNILALIQNNRSETLKIYEFANGILYYFMKTVDI